MAVTRTACDAAAERAAAECAAAECAAAEHADAEPSAARRPCSPRAPPRTPPRAACARRAAAAGGIAAWSLPRHNAHARGAKQPAPWDSRVGRMSAQVACGASSRGAHIGGSSSSRGEALRQCTFRQRALAVHRAQCRVATHASHVRESAHGPQGPENALRGLARAGAFNCLRGVGWRIETAARAASVGGARARHERRPTYFETMLIHGAGGRTAHRTRDVLPCNHKWRLVEGVFPPNRPCERGGRGPREQKSDGRDGHMVGAGSAAGGAPRDAA